MSGTGSLPVTDVEAKAKARSSETRLELDRIKPLERHRMGGILDPTISSLARELAQDILPAIDILRNHGFSGLDDPNWIAIERSTEFRHLLMNAIAEWTAADSTKKRITLKSQAALEAALPTLYSISQDPTEAGANRLKAIEHLGKFGGLGTEASVNAGNGRPSFVVNIKLATGESIRVSDMQDATPASDTDSNPAPESSLSLSVGKTGFLLGDVIKEDAE